MSIKPDVLSPSSNSVVTLNVGGRKFSTSLATLRADPESMLARMFDPESEFRLVEDGNGAVFIDRSPRHFEIILDYLRDGYCPQLPDDQMRNEVMREAQFYQLTHLVSELNR